MRTRTFPPTRSREYLLGELSRHAEVVCARAREHGLRGSVFSFFLKTQGFQYVHESLKLARPEDIPEQLVGLIEEHFDRLYDPDMLYRAAGATLGKLIPSAVTQLDLFDMTQKHERLRRVHQNADRINQSSGDTVLHLASSMNMVRNKRVEQKNTERLPLPLIGHI